MQQQQGEVELRPLLLFACCKSVRYLTTGIRSSGKSSRGREFVTRPMHGNKMDRLAGVSLELLPQLQYLVVNGARGWIRVITPHLVEQLFAANNSLWTLEEEAQQFKSMRSQ